MEACDGWGYGGVGECDNRRYLVTHQCLETMLILSQKVIIGESCVRDSLDLTYTQLKDVRKYGYVDINNARVLVTNLYQ